MNALDPTPLDRRNQGWMRVECPVLADLSAQPKRFSIGRKKQLDGRSIKADPVVERFHLMALVDATNDHHSHQNRAFIDVTWIACVKRGSVEVGSPLKGKLSSNLNEAWRGGADYVAEIRIFVLTVHSSRPEKLSMVEDVVG